MLIFKGISTILCDMVNKMNLNYFTSFLFIHFRQSKYVKLHYSIVAGVMTFE